MQARTWNLQRADSCTWLRPRESSSSHNFVDPENRPAEPDPGAEFRGRGLGVAMDRGLLLLLLLLLLFSRLSCHLQIILDTENTGHAIGAQVSNVLVGL